MAPDNRHDLEIGIILADPEIALERLSHDFLVITRRIRQATHLFGRWIDNAFMQIVCIDTLEPGKAVEQNIALAFVRNTTLPYFITVTPRAS